MPFGDTLVALGVGDFLFPLTGVVEAGAGFSGAAGAGSFSFCSFSLCFSSLEGAGKQEKNQTFKIQHDTADNCDFGPIVQRLILRWQLKTIRKSETK